MSALLTTSAYLLRSVAVGERDLILTLLTESRGKISAIARGGQASKRRFAGALEPLQRIELELTHAERDIATLNAARIERPYPALSLRLERLDVAGRALRWARHVLPPRVPEPELWASLERLLRDLENAEDDGSAELFVFGLELLEIVGVAMTFDKCGVCGRPRPEGRSAHVDVARGGIVCTSCGGARRTLDAETLDALVHVTRGPALGVGLELIEAALSVHTSYEEGGTAR